MSALAKKFLEQTPLNQRAHRSEDREIIREAVLSGRIYDATSGDALIRSYKRFHNEPMLDGWRETVGSRMRDRDAQTSPRPKFRASQQSRMRDHTITQLRASVPHEGR